jgi:type II secretory pathway component PulF
LLNKDEEKRLDEKIDASNKKIIEDYFTPIMVSFFTSLVVSILIALIRIVS